MLVPDRMARGDYEGAKAAVECVQRVDAVRAMLLGRNGVEPRPPASEPEEQGSFPRYCREADRVTKIGPSRDGGTYEHVVPKPNFEEILAVLVQYAQKARAFETKQLQHAIDHIPHHQPSTVLGILERQGLIEKEKRGRWAFVDRRGFAVAARSVWNNIPRS
jgi:hypothetical protein